MVIMMLSVLSHCTETLAKLPLWWSELNMNVNDAQIVTKGQSMKRK